MKFLYGLSHGFMMAALYMRIVTGQRTDNIDILLFGGFGFFVLTAIVHLAYEAGKTVNKS